MEGGDFVCFLSVPMYITSSFSSSLLIFFPCILEAAIPTESMTFERESDLSLLQYLKININKNVKTIIPIITGIKTGGSNKTSYHGRLLANGGGGGGETIGVLGGDG